MLEISVDVLWQMFDYCRETGEFKHSQNASLRWRGKPAGCRDALGYLHLSIRGKRYPAHRCAWAWSYGKWPEKFIDHINGDARDNRLANLRQATKSQNNYNSRPSSRNKSGYTGVSWCARTRSWQVHVGIGNRRQKALGRYKRLEDAVAVRTQAIEMVAGRFAPHLSRVGGLP